MIKAFVLSTVLAVGVSSFASAAILPAPVDRENSNIVTVAQGCGPGWFRDAWGHCRPMGYRPAPYYRPYAHRCWWRAGVRICR